MGSSLKLEGGLPGGTPTSKFFRFTADDYTDLTTVVAPTADVLDIAYVRSSQGTSWLPGTLGGTYFPAGAYIWDGAAWVSDRNAIASFLEQNKNTVDTVDPTASDDDTDLYRIGSLWFNSSTNRWFLAQSLVASNAVWVNLPSGGATVVDSSDFITDTLTSDQDDYDPTGYRSGGIIIITYIDITANVSDVSFSGLVPSSPALRNIVVFHNSGTKDLKFQNEDFNSLAANRFSISIEQVIPPQQSIGLIYDINDLRWEMLYKST